MNDADIKWSKACAYVHGELSPEERKSVELAVGHDAELKDMIERFKVFNKKIAPMMEASRWTDEEIQDRLLKEWEREQRAPAPIYEMKPESISPALLGPSHFWRWIWGGAALAAACLLIFFGPLARQREYMSWGALILHPAEFRGGENASDVLNDAAMDRMDARLRELLRPAALRAKAGRDVSDKWTIDRAYYDLAGPAFRVELAALRRGETVSAKSWARIFASEQQFDEEARGFADTIAREIAELSKPGATP